MDNEHFFETLFQDTDQLILGIKKRGKRAKTLLEVYLRELPSIVVQYKVLFENTWKCRHWLDSVLKDIGLHCKHCVHNDNCEQQCMSIWEKYLMETCSICNTKKDKKHCQKLNFSRLERAINKKTYSIEREYESLKYCQCSLKFGVGSTYRSGYFVAYTMPVKHTESTPEEYSVEFLHRLGMQWVYLRPIDELGDRYIEETVLTIISLTFMYLWDLFQNSLFSGVGQRLDKNDDTHNYESSNVIAAYVCHKEGQTYEEIKKLLNANINPNEVLIGDNVNNKFDVRMQKNANTHRIIKAINNLYNSGKLPETSIGSLSLSIAKMFELHLNDERLTSDNTEITEFGSFYKPKVNPQYLLYKSYLRLAGLIEAIVGTRFRNRIPIIFTADYLVRFQSALQETGTFKAACKKISLGYTTVHMAIDTHLKRNPAYYRISKSIEKEETYGRLKMYIEQSTEEELQKWKNNVNKLDIKPVSLK